MARKRELQNLTLDDILFGTAGRQPSYCTYPERMWVSDCYEAYLFLLDNGEKEPLHKLCENCSWKRGQIGRY
jgi:hypothetical protein